MAAMMGLGGMGGGSNSAFGGLGGMGGLGAMSGNCIYNFLLINNIYHSQIYIEWMNTNKQKQQHRTMLLPNLSIVYKKKFINKDLFYRDSYQNE